jgi:hypothetical protein
MSPSTVPIMLVWIVAGQRLDPVPPEDREHSETTAEGGEWPDQSNLGDGRLIAGVRAVRLRVSSARESCSLQVLDLTCVLQGSTDEPSYRFPLS